MFSTSIKDFKIEKVLGKGSFGSVYLVTRKEDQKIYALKSVIMEKLNKKEQENSVNEVRILASVNHPNVIGYKEAFWDDQNNTLNIVMEYADDGDLQTKIQKMKKNCGFFEEDLIWSYSIQMIEGLKALHDKKIMHRDLKSANIFLVKNKKQCKLGDMNVSKVIKEKVLRTQTGTPYYASPEVWNDKPYSYKSDLWSIGCVIYELCALRPPFKGKDLDELYINVCRGKVDRINKVYSDNLWKMIMMLLQVDVNKRVNCDQFLNHPLIVRKIKEMKSKSSEYKDLEDNKNIHDGYLLNTINFKDLKEIKSQLPTRKNYENSKKIQRNTNNNYSSFENKHLKFNNNYNDYYKYLNNNINHILNNNIIKSNNHSHNNDDLIKKNNHENEKNYVINNYERKFNKDNNNHKNTNIINDINVNKYSEILNNLKKPLNNINKNQKFNIINDYLNSNSNEKINYNKYNIYDNIFHTEANEGVSGLDRISFLKNERDKLKVNSGIELNYDKLNTEEKISNNENYAKIKKEKNKDIEKYLENECKTIEDEKNDFKNLMNRINKRLEEEHKFNYLNIHNDKDNERQIKIKNMKLNDKYIKLINDINNNNILKNNKNIFSAPEQILKTDVFNKYDNNTSSSRLNKENGFFPISKVNNNKIHIKPNNYIKSSSKPFLKMENSSNNNIIERSKTPCSNYIKLSSKNINKFKDKYYKNNSNYEQINKSNYKSLLNQISYDHITSLSKSKYINEIKNNINNINSLQSNPKANNIKRINKRIVTINKKKKTNNKENKSNTKISKNRNISAIPIKRIDKYITINNNLNVYDINNISNQYSNYPINSLNYDYNKILNDINLTSINNIDNYIKRHKNISNDKLSILIDNDITNIQNRYSPNNVSKKLSFNSNNIKNNENKSSNSFNFINPSSATNKNYTLLKKAKKLGVRSNSYRISNHQKNYINKKRELDYRYDLTEPEPDITKNIKINKSKTNIQKMEKSLFQNGLDLLGITNTSNGNTFLKNIKSNDITNHFVHINKGNRLSGRYYLNIQNAQKCPQIFNNYYSINGVNSSSIPIKVINVFNNK